MVTLLWALWGFTHFAGSCSYEEWVEYWRAYLHDCRALVQILVQRGQEACFAVISVSLVMSFETAPCTAVIYDARDGPSVGCPVVYVRAYVPCCQQCNFSFFLALSRSTGKRRGRLIENTRKDTHSTVLSTEHLFWWAAFLYLPSTEKRKRNCQWLQYSPMWSLNATLHLFPGSPENVNSNGMNCVHICTSYLLLKLPNATIRIPDMVV